MQEIKVFPLKIHEWLFLISGIAILISLAFIEVEGFILWTFAKVSYFTGIFFFILNILKKKDNHNL